MLTSAIIKEFKLLSRDLHGVAVLFLMPILFMLIMSAALSNDSELTRHSSIVLLSEKENKLNDDLYLALKEKGLNIEKEDIKKLSDFYPPLLKGDISLLIANYNNEKTALSDEKQLVLWLNPSVDPAWLLGVKGVIQKHYTEQRIHYFLQTKNITLENNKQPQVKKIQNKVNKELDKTFEQINNYLAQELWQENYLTKQGYKVKKPNSVQHSVPAWLIFGMFFIMIPLSNVMAMERQTNTITRLKMAQSSAFQLILAKLIPYFLINQFQFIGMIGLGYYILPLLNMPQFELNGLWWHYLILSFAVSLACLGYGLLISIIAKTTEQAVVLGGGGIIIMAAIGGIMVPIYVMPEIMQIISQFSPMGWALNAFQDLLLNQATLIQIQQPLFYLFLFSMISLILSILLYRKQLITQARF